MVLEPLLYVCAAREKMKKGETYEGTVEKVFFPNKGRVMIGEDIVTVKNTIPGQKIKFIINKKRSGNFEGRLLEVLEKSDLEAEERKCGIFTDCGGCSYQTLNYDRQLHLKYEQVRELLLPVLVGEGALPYDAAEAVFGRITESPEQFGYRNKMEYSFGDSYKGGPLALGLHKKGTMYDILNASDCVLVHEDINKIVRCVHEYCMENNLPYYRKNIHEGFLRHLLVRRSASTGEMTAALVITTQMEHDFHPLAKRLCALELDGRLAGIMLMHNDSVADVVRSEKTVLLFGKDYFYEELLGLKFKITPFSFFQTNTRGAEKLYMLVRDMIGDVDGATVFDLYSGTGTIAQIVSGSAKKVIGIEIVPEAVRAARENAHLNGLKNCEFYEGDVLKALDEITEKPDFLILDPPREGIHLKAIRKIIDYQAERIVYVSCKPTSLAADLKQFLAGGYKVAEIKCVDMFPQTVHTETICALIRVK